MIECFTENVSTGQNEAIAWNNTNIKKGCTVENNGASIQFNKCGIYEVSVNASVVSANATDSAPVDLSMELYKNGVAMPQAKQTVTAIDDTSKHGISFTTLVQVAENNSCCPCASPTICTVRNTGGAVTVANASLVVTKLV